ncbi:MAG: YraN family protein [Oscillospiraceae bacterium]|nr:YraN family protein [Oscillospiraceae bacterium]
MAAALERRGWTILARQYRCRWGEIDLIARAPEGVLCFVEVKTRSPQAIAPPREAVTASKRRKLRDAASWYLAQTGLDCPCRFDVAEVFPADTGGRRQINYITSAFE